MDFFDKLGSIAKNVGDKTVSFAKNVGDKTNVMIEKGKLNSKINATKSTIEEHKAKLGAYFWEQYEAGAVFEGEAEDICNAIRACYTEIEGFEAEIRALEEEKTNSNTNETDAQGEAAQRPQFCSNCGAPLQSGIFCSTCGAKIEA